MSRRAAPKANAAARSAKASDMSRRAAPKANAAARSAQASDIRRRAAPKVISAAAIAPQAWRNGGGQTRELFTWPALGPWRLRISRADIDADGPFSAFPGVTRWFAVLQGHGVALTLDGRRHDLLADSDALCFDGAQAPPCHLLDGPTQDLNLMAVGGQSVMARVQPDVPWQGPWTMRGLYTPVAGQWRNANAQCAVDADSLLLMESADGGAWTFAPAPDIGGRADGRGHGGTAAISGNSGNSGISGGSAWWLGFTPKE